ncbi:hypothetical protein DPPLL_07720 [Desulfofustis limnaeus]|uniref:Uncharacterized protein n=1 Tax=Desulfofustis limnaeus TaxID=2740163 RepID=A0ABN6M0H9_9BACT|nr:hypothetical protein DPPLL_07720 [Desulfofustis limnaeus]
MVKEHLKIGSNGLSRRFEKQRNRTNQKRLLLHGQLGEVVDPVEVQRPHHQHDSEQGPEEQPQNLSGEALAKRLSRRICCRFSHGMHKRNQAFDVWLSTLTSVPTNRGCMDHSGDNRKIDPAQPSIVRK